jgi:hypothetical protein
MRICSGAGCLRAVPDDVQLCTECRPSKAIQASDGIKAHNTGYDPELDRLRKSPRWQRLSHSVLRSQPICKRCDHNVAEITDHVVPAREAMAQMELAGRGRTEGYFLRSNLQGLCRACHWVKTNEDKTHVGEWPDVIENERLAPPRKWTF